MWVCGKKRCKTRNHILLFWNVKDKLNGTLFHHDGEKNPILIFSENFISVPDLLQESFILNSMQQHCVKLHVIIEF